MKIKNILVSQPAPAVIEKSPYNELISKYHIHAQFHPFIKVEGVSLKEFRSQRIEILDHTAVIFTPGTRKAQFASAVPIPPLPIKAMRISREPTDSPFPTTPEEFPSARSWGAEGNNIPPAIICLIKVLLFDITSVIKYPNH